MAYALVRDETTPEGRAYKGQAEQGVAEFQGPPEQLLPVGFVALIASEFFSAVRSGGETPLSIKVWADISPTLYTRYRVELTLTSPAVAAGAHAFPFAWLAAAALLLGLLLVAAWVIRSVPWGAISTVFIAGALLVAAVFLAPVLAKRLSGTRS